MAYCRLVPEKYFGLIMVYCRLVTEKYQRISDVLLIIYMSKNRLSAAGSV